MVISAACWPGKAPDASDNPQYDNYDFTGSKRSGIYNCSYSCHVDLQCTYGYHRRY